MRVRRTGILALIVLLLPAGSAAAYWYLVVQTYHFATVDPGVLYRDGNRDVREFAHAVRRSGARTVVSLIEDRELDDPSKPQFAAEAAWCATHGVRQVRIPVKLGGWPTTADVRTFLATVRDPANRPVLVHCAQGVRRTGMFVAAYERAALHEPPDRVIGEVLSFGHKPRDTDDVRTFIDQYDPSTGRVPTSQPIRSGE